MPTNCTFCTASANHFLFPSTLFRRLSSSIKKTMVLALSSPLIYTSGSQSSSKFRGVLGLRSSKWGARISYNYKSFWLGAYDREQDAAMAYDRAAIKLQRSDAALNFPIATYTVQETRFQAQHSDEEVLHMIRDKTYLYKLADFLSDLSSARGFGGIMSQNGGISVQLLFQKELTHTDVTCAKGFQIPREYAVQHFPPLTSESSGTGEGEKRFIEIIFYDRHDRAWTFRYSFWKSTQTYVFTKGWGHFLRMNRLKPKDSVLFYQCVHQSESEGVPYFMIGVQRDEEVKLFGVPIGKRKRERTY